MSSSHDLISKYSPFIVEPLFKVTLIHWSTYMAKMEVQIKMLKTVHFSWITPIFRLDCSLSTNRRSCISWSVYFRTQPFMAASGEWTFKRNPNLAHTRHGCSWTGYLPFLGTLPSAWPLQSSWINLLDCCVDEFLYLWIILDFCNKDLTFFSLRRLYVFKCFLKIPTWKTD